ncbi:MAG: hypothetical protein U0893_26525 [Chloroflexota bacterium]
MGGEGFPATLSLRWRADLPFLIALAAAILLVTSIPYVFAYATAPADRQFMGLTHTTHDYAQYISWARESQDKVFVENKLTPEPSEASFFNPVWWLIGRIERLFGLSFAAVNQGFRVLAGLTFVLTLGALAGRVFPGPERRFAVALTCLTSGLGWLLVLAKQWTGELSIPLLVHTFPGNTFFGMMVVPHMILSCSMLIGVFFLVVETARRTCGRRALLAGLLCMLLGFAHPYNIATAYSVIGAFAVLITLRDGIRWRWLMGIAAIYVISAPSVLYWMWVSAQSEAWRQVLAQYKNLGVFTPNPAQLIVLLGLTAVLAAVTFRGFVPLKQRRVEELFVACWLAVNAVIIYLPLDFQINLLSGIQVPLAFLATRGLYEHVVPWLRETLPAKLSLLPGALGRIDLRGLTRYAPILFLLLVLPTNLYLVSWRVLDLSRHKYPDYLYKDDVAALAWIEQQSAATPADVVLSSLEIGHWIPGLTGAHAFLAHGANTLDFYGKRAMVQRFYAADGSDQDRQATLAKFRVRYVFYGPSERALGTFDPATASYLEAAFTTPHTTVYRVILPGSAAIPSLRSGQALAAPDGRSGQDGRAPSDEAAKIAALPGR